MAPVACAAATKQKIRVQQSKSKTKFVKLKVGHLLCHSRPVRPNRIPSDQLKERLISIEVMKDRECFDSKVRMSFKAFERHSPVANAQENYFILLYRLVKCFAAPGVPVDLTKRTYSVSIVHHENHIIGALSFISLPGYLHVAEDTYAV